MRRTLRKMTKNCPLTTSGVAMRKRTFDDIVAWVSGLRRNKHVSCENNLEVTHRFLDALDMRDHLKKLRFVHVAGTKGKGTTSKYVSAFLKDHGYRVGLFTSPHISDIRERIQVDNAMLPKDLFTRYFFEMQDRIEELADSESLLCRSLPSRKDFFCFMFLLSLHVFCEMSVDVVVVEVGMGGRIDSTNVITPEVSVITALGVDHVDVLGHTVEKIALEKAGIMKPGVVCYTTPQQDHPSTLDVLKTHGRNVQAPVVVVDELTLPIRNWPKLAIGGDHAVENSKLGLLAARHVVGIPPTEPLREAERHVLQTMTFAGRSQVVPIGGEGDPTLYLDGAHTYESLTAITRWFLKESTTRTGDPSPRRVLVFYSSRKPSNVLKAFGPFHHAFSKVIIAFVENPATRRDSGQSDHEVALGEVTALESCWKELYPEFPCISLRRPFRTLQELLDLAAPTVSDWGSAPKPAQILVTGSFFIIGDIMKVLERDEFGLMAEEVERAM